MIEPPFEARNNEEKLNYFILCVRYNNPALSLVLVTPASTNINTAGTACSRTKRGIIGVLSYQIENEKQVLKNCARNYTDRAWPGLAFALRASLTSSSVLKLYARVDIFRLM